MTELFLKKDNVTDEDQVFRSAIIFLGMKQKVKEDSKFRTPENQQAIKDFLGRSNFLFAWAAGVDSVAFSSDLNKVNMTRKVLLIVKAVEPTQEYDSKDTNTNIGQRIVCMEISKPILESLHSFSTEVFLPVLGNPHNQIGWSDLVSKDLMEKFHSFLAHTYVTIGQIKGRCMLPLPPAEVTQSEKTLSKEKSQVLETAIIHWTKQIKNVLKMDPENALKNGNNPGPMAEIDFWEKQALNLDSIYDQLNTERIKKVLKFLEQNKSTFISPFSKLQKEVQIARLEANENKKYLQTLRELFESLNSGTLELGEMQDLFIPIMHTILMIYIYSSHYNTTPRLVVLIREICNEIIKQCRGQVSGPQIFEELKESPQSAYIKLSQALEVCVKFKEAYFEYKSKAKNSWKITSSALFVRLDAFSERCQDLMQMTQTIMQFNKLEKIEVGNTKGAAMTNAVKQIFEEFQNAQTKFCSVNYDVMDIEQRAFDDDFFAFRQTIKELERRIAALLAQSFEDCDTIIGKFKLLESFEGLLNRPSINDELEKKQTVLLDLYKNDLKKVNQVFAEGRELLAVNDPNSPISRNMPVIAGALNWSNGLRGRIQEPMDRLLSFTQSMQDREEFKDAQKLYASIQQNLNSFDTEQIKIWQQGVEENTHQNLDKSLLVREATEIAVEGFVRVNFANELRAILREVKYLQLLDFPIPETALKLFAKVETYRVQTLRLQIIVDMYNNILATLLPVEKPLLAKKIDNMGKSLQAGIDTLKWNSEGIDKFISVAHATVQEVDELVKKMKENVTKIHTFMDCWKDKVFFERKPKPMPPDELMSSHTATVENRFEEVLNQGKEITKLLRDTESNIKPEKSSSEWRAYVDYVNGLVIAGITTGINASLLDLLKNININQSALQQPIFDLKINLQNRSVQFEPSIQCNSRENGIRDIINSIVNDFVSLAIKMPRLDTGTGDYLVEIRDQFELFGSIQAICHQLNEIEKACADFIEQYSSFAFLWKEDLDTFFSKFLEQGKDLKDTFEADLALRAPDMEEVQIQVERENFDQMIKKIYNGVATKQPALEKFDEQIQHLSEIKHQIKSMKETDNVGWLKVDSTPIKTELTDTIQRWINKFTSFLMENFKNKLKNIESWSKDVHEGISQLPKQQAEGAKVRTEKEKKLLITVMTHLRDVKQIKENTVEQFAPMRDTIQMLKKHAENFEMENVDFMVKCETAKTFLNEVSEKALGPVKESILPLQKEEGKNVQERRKFFVQKVLKFRGEFMTELPYHTQQSSPEIINGAYSKISEYYMKLKQIEAERDDLANQETLFDLERSIYKELKECSVELINLKKMWDLIALIDMQFESWRNTLWDQIDTDLLTTLIKDMQTKQCNPTQPQNKDIKNYRAFQALNERVKNMNTILPLIAQLHSPFMLERHWRRLETKIVKKAIPFKSDKFCLADLIQLELFKVGEDVSELVDSAQKEDKINKKLDGIKAIWEDQIFSFNSGEDGIPLLTSLDQITEYVDTHSLDLMGMQSSKDVEEFREEVTKWVKTLKTVDTVIGKWIKVQKDYLKLQPIFLQSDDIRNSLPDETKRFEKVDQDFQQLMRDAQDEPKVTECAGAEGREALLNELMNEINSCEKALNEYLEAKKKMFPRFYFIPNASLLEILSNGNNPRRVDDFLGDCFDGMRSMNLRPQDFSDKTPMQGRGMIAKDGEYVPFKDPFICQGQVEHYLSNLEEKMKSTLGEILCDARETTDDWIEPDPKKQREFWLNNYCAQLALTATQVVWTEETTRAFDDLESGSEGAMSDNLKQIVIRVGKLIDRVRTDLTEEVRTKIITIITIDVHSRDVIEKFVAEKINSQEHFAWQSQLKFYLEQKDKKDTFKKCASRICDWSTWYNYEFVGNCGRLVITPLTDRCYITLTQALNLSMGGAPAGPAGTGKTETTKDLGRALGLHVVVYNCSPQMNYKGMAEIFMGLSQAGSWGCFDEFNRIEISVLSVVSTQVKYCLDAIKVLKGDPSKFLFKFGDDEDIPMRITSGYFITMNPGYAGRTELPENLKALFRSCAMVVPDIVLICENMLMAEGFNTARDLSKKFMTLYNLSSSLLSKQRHYDWGLRAVKSVLRQAGILKRMSPNDPEKLILMRALRDFNTPKIVLDDIDIFMGLINDLFPGCDPPVEFKANVKEACEQCARDPELCAFKEGRMNIKCEERFIQKCVELYELLVVRHSVFIIGVPGSAKSTIWKLLARACTHIDHETTFDIVDPKCVKNEELFGNMNPKTKEWKDGVLSTMMRDMSKCQGKFTDSQKYKWVILDGDVDPMWIESMNTVMDDNKMLTLVSQERIPLSKSMRLILEVSHLKNATPATVSRGGVLFVNEFDIGWKPYWESWIQKFKNQKSDPQDLAYTTFVLNLGQYCDDNFIEEVRKRPAITPMCLMAYIQSLTHIIDFMYEELRSEKKYTEFFKKLKDGSEPELNARFGSYEEAMKLIYEGVFVFAMIWSFGGPQSDERIWFSNSIKQRSTKIRFPEAVNQVYDYYFDVMEQKWELWQTNVDSMDPNFEGLFSNLIVPTAETSRQIRLINVHKQSRKGLFYVGIAGTGKTTIMKNYFAKMNREEVIAATVNFNSYTDSQAFQVVLESNVQKRFGKQYGPPIGKKLLLFIDDINMPVVDDYGTQQPICLIRQIIDYELVYDRSALSEQKFIKDIMFLACMNPKSGSFNIDLRLQRHFTTVALSLPDNVALNTIYGQILAGHFSNFDQGCKDMVDKIINATSSVFNAITKDSQFKPTATKFHYQFNLRDFAKIVQNIMLAQPNVYRGNQLGLARLWLHECHRVWQDRFIRQEDNDKYMGFLQTSMKEFSSFKQDDIFSEPLVFTSFVTACKGHDPAYMNVASMEDLNQVLEDKLQEYNENVSAMDLVLFNMAMCHITRIARIIDQPNGHALLVGVGGSGKQSLSKLTSFILSYDVFRIVVTSSYSPVDLRADIQTVFKKAGVTGTQTLFILTDAQIVNERFLIDINDILSSGYVPELFAQDEKDEITGKVRSEAKSSGVADIAEDLWNFYLDKTMKHLHLCLCFSPVSEKFRIRARKFPALINCTSIDWFHEWPEDALIGVANRFLKEVELPSDEIRENLARHMAFVHISIGEANIEFKRTERRFNYTTPTSYLELINFYKMLLGSKQGTITDQIERLEKGLSIMADTTARVDNLKKELEATQKIVEIEKSQTQELIDVVEEESAKAAVEEENAATQAAETKVIKDAADAKKANVDKELAAAIPAMEQARAAVDGLSAKSIGEFKGMTSPPAGCEQVTKAVQILRGEYKKHDWDAAKIMMKDPNKFKESLEKYDKDNIPDKALEALKDILSLDYFNETAMMKKSSAAANMCKWVVAIVEYNRIYRNVKPLQDAAEEAAALAKLKGEELQVVLDALEIVRAKVRALNEKLDTAKLQLQKVLDQAAALMTNLNLAERLVNGLSDEQVRWTANVITFQEEKLTMIGNALLSAAFVSYIGPFLYTFRNRLWQEQWLPDIIQKKIPISAGIDPLMILSNKSLHATWAQQDLPADRVSLENAAIIVSCSRYPLIIDPQLQGIRWIKGKEGAAMQIIQLTEDRWLKKVEVAVSEGQILMIEAIGQDIDAILDPLLSRAFIKRGKNFFVKLGSEEVEVNKTFKLYLQTKLINPHYKPETAAQCTIINFLVTEKGLEDQLLASVVRVEQPELEQSKEELTAKQNQYQITLAELESKLLQNLSDADPNTILQNIGLIERLELTKETSVEIKRQQQISLITEENINKLREVYRVVATEGAMLYFLLIQLNVVEFMYQYSLKSFETFFFKAIEKTPKNDDIEERGLSLRQIIRETIYQWVSRGLYERHKQIFMTQLTFRLMQKKIVPIDYTIAQMDYLVNCPQKFDPQNPNPVKKWLPDTAWASVLKLVEIEGFEQIQNQIGKEASKRFEDWYNEDRPEEMPLPGDYRSLEADYFKKLLVIRTLRPDRMTTALNKFIAQSLPNGQKAFVECDNQFNAVGILEQAFLDSSPTIPIYYILSPGANPIKDVEELCQRQKVNKNQFHLVSLGQGQEINAFAKLEMGHKEGHWVMLQNIHLMPSFLKDLEDKLAVYSVAGSHANFRLFLTSDPSKEIPIGLIERSIKLTNEPPAGMKANLLRAFGFFQPAEFDFQDNKLKTILFALSYFHAVMVERRKFGPKGWNAHYNFSIGDLRDSALVCQNYLDKSSQGGGKTPWDDLRYIFGDIMYGGYITDDIDREMCKTFLINMMNDQLFEEPELFPFVDKANVSFKCPNALSHDKYIEHINEELPPETPLAFGMHPNAEIDFRTTQCKALFTMLVELAPKGAAGGDENAPTPLSRFEAFEDRVSNECNLESNKPNVEDIRSKLGDDPENEMKPYQNVFLQECEVIGVLIDIVLKSLQDIVLANKGELTMSEQMENLMNDIFMNKVPASWMNFSFETTRGLASWLDNLKQRLEQLNAWKDEPSKLPTVTWLNRLKNPQSFLTAIQQIFARKHQLELNKLFIQTEVTRKWYWDAELPQPKIHEGALVFGLQVEGARWDFNACCLEESEPKKQFSAVPVVWCKAQELSKKKENDPSIFDCPMYLTPTRGKTYVNKAQMKTKMHPNKWILAGVSIILDVEGFSDQYRPGFDPTK